MSKRGYWNSRDKAPMLLGIYEKEVLDSLTDLPKHYSTFIDLGAADGYYSVGVLVNNIFKKSICYELDELGRELIKENAILNNVLERIEIKGLANKNFYEEISEHDIKHSVILIDIEGSEFEFFSKKTFNIFKNSIIFIELHDFMFSNGDDLLIDLKNKAKDTHIIEILTMGSRDLSSYEEVKNFDDNDRWLICSEGRGKLMSWLKLVPKN